MPMKEPNAMNPIDQAIKVCVSFVVGVVIASAIWHYGFLTILKGWAVLSIVLLLMLFAAAGLCEKDSNLCEKDSNDDTF